MTPHFLDAVFTTNPRTRAKVEFGRPVATKTNSHHDRIVMKIWPGRLYPFSYCVMQ